MKVTFVNYYYDKDIPIDKYLERYPTIHGWCRALKEQGLDVQVYNRFNKNYSFNQDGAEYILVKDKLRNDLKWYQAPHHFHKKISAEKHEIFHVNSFNYSYQASLLKRRFPKSKVIVQHHAENPNNLLKRFLMRRFTSSVDGYIFSSKGIYDNWLKDELIFSCKNFAEIIEDSTYFKLIERDVARSITGLAGNPVLLWVGRLNDNKDPITLLNGFKKLLNDYPEARLYMIYSAHTLERVVKSKVEQIQLLKNSVSLLGFIEHCKLEHYFNSSDYFVLGSHYEGSGYSLVEAMACGVIPIVTDIPAFRMITDDGKVGSLWKSGDPESFYIKSKIILGKEFKTESRKALKQFNKNLSYSAIGEKAKNFYEEVIFE